MDDAGDDPMFELHMERAAHDKVIKSVATVSLQSYNFQPRSWGDYLFVRSQAALREGIDAGRGETVQEGFDDGYAAGAAAGFAQGRLLGVLRYEKRISFSSPRK
jgi:hypothetical protein